VNEILHEFSLELWPLPGRQAMKHRVGILPVDPDGLRGSDLIGQVDGRPGFFDAEAISGKDFPIDLRVEIVEPIGKLNFLTIDGDRAERPLPGRLVLLGEVVAIDG